MVKCKGGCGTDVEVGKFGELCLKCWKAKKGKKLQTLAINTRPQDPTKWHRSWTKCLFCLEQVRTIRAMKLHYHMTECLKNYDKLTEEERNALRAKRDDELAHDSYEGDEKRAWF